jgi:hypothetical protein
MQLVAAVPAKRPIRKNAPRFWSCRIRSFSSPLGTLSIKPVKLCVLEWVVAIRYAAIQAVSKEVNFDVGDGN